MLTTQDIEDTEMGASRLYGLDDQGPDERYQDYCRRVSEEMRAEEQGRMAGLAYAILAVLAVVSCWCLAAYLPGVMG